MLVIEGALYALFPERMQRMMAQAIALPPNLLRYGGLFAACAGFLVVWAMRG